jgi:hypothetical protein
LKVPDQKLTYHLALLKAIGKSGLGELAKIAGQVLTEISTPKAVCILVRLAGLDDEVYLDGQEHSCRTLQNATSDYGFQDFDNKNTLPNTLLVTLDDGSVISIASLKILGAPVGYIAAVTDGVNEAAIPFSEGVWLCATQLSLRLNTIMAPGSPLETELLGRQILTALDGDGVKYLTIGFFSGKDDWVSLYRENDGIRSRQIERLPSDQAAAINDGEIIGENTLRYLWVESKVAAGVWVSSESGYNLALGFEDRKLASANVANKVKEFIDKKYRNDAAYLVKSFEKLKGDFKKLVKAERAAAITETTVTINHEINNPLTAILGNTQLMLMSRDKLPADVVVKLETIERSAIKIRETTTKLMSIIDPVTTAYASGLEMIDIEKSKKKPSKE